MTHTIEQAGITWTIGEQMKPVGDENFPSSGVVVEDDFIVPGTIYHVDGDYYVYGLPNGKIYKAWM
jgi:hypothetical protein